MRKLKIPFLSTLLACAVSEDNLIVSSELRTVIQAVSIEFEQRGMQDPFKRGEWLIQTDSMPDTRLGYIEHSNGQTFIAINKNNPSDLDFEEYAFIELLHELGHYYGLEHGQGDIMDPGFSKLYMWPYFKDDYLDEYFKLLKL